ncbi:histidine ammonia-lyase [Bowdeniella nasicola]|uniref:Histidine ammonia-lyase n=1 Tax=Bowdeniella nasicola TaxID=208480 RepID=A0A1Q5Q3R7_9ACTO|nr:histidine ammonia-lyase [Bowdeniella nasicola]OKL54451.1 histidine ammonia-lyase [Bowdeniella nasicola]
MPRIIIGDEPLTIDDVVVIARHGALLDLSAAAWQRVREARTVVDTLAGSDTPHYGVSTGFGALATTHIPPDRRAQLQRSLVRSHAAGSGQEVEDEVTRAMMAIRIQSLATGHTGIRPETLQTYLDVLNAGIVPVVHEYGSLGCSGDLSPLAHCALALMGEGRVRVKGAELSAADALAECGIAAVELTEKEGLALINGTDGMLAMACLAIADLHVLLDTADLATAMSVDALLGTDAAFAPELIALRPQVGQQKSAAQITEFMADSEIRASHKDVDDGIVQDAYSLRCAPQVTGAVRDTLDFATTIATRELSAAIDNPVIYDGQIASNGNFHGAPVGYILDFLAIACADLASICERRTDRLLDTKRSHGLAPFLAHEVGVDSGMMIAQYTSAGIVSELKRLAAPASVDSIPSSAMQEDHVSMGWAAGRKLRRVIDGLTRVIGIEILCAARGLQLRAPLAPSPSASRVIDALAAAGVAGPGPDRFLSHDIDIAVTLVASGAALAAGRKENI